MISHVAPFDGLDMSPLTNTTSTAAYLHFAFRVSGRVFTAYHVTLTTMAGGTLYTIKKRTHQMLRKGGYSVSNSRSGSGEDLGAARVGDEDEAQGEGDGEGGDEDELDGVGGVVDEVEGRYRPDEQERGRDDGDGARGERDGALVETADLGAAVAGRFRLYGVRGG